ncbi:MAG: YihY/virulence factor BrkB family protein [Lachnospiraceae bacterium]|nr:YihY/virulence factor BrkB family protein [Lachnospiraceae bacterium]
MKETSKRLLQKFRETLGNLSSFQLDVYSSGAAFFIFISMIPFILIILYIIPYISFSQTEFITLIVRFIPDDFQMATEVLIRGLYSRSRAILPISIITLLWSASRGILAITKGLNRINHVDENRNYFIVRGISILYTVLMIVVVMLLFILGLFGKRIFRLIEQNFENLHGIASSIYHYSDLIVIVFLFLLFLFMYKFLPARHMILKEQLPGALLSSVVWWGFTELFSYYILQYNAYSMYGSLAMVVMLLVWIYAGLYFFFFGAWLNLRISLK